LFMNQNQEKILNGYLSDIIFSRDYPINITGLSGSEKAYLATRLYLQHQAPVVVIAPSVKEAEMQLEDLRFFSKKMGFKRI